MSDPVDDTAYRIDVKEDGTWLIIPNAGFRLEDMAHGPITQKAISALRTALTQAGTGPRKVFVLSVQQHYANHFYVVGVYATRTLAEEAATAEHAVKDSVIEEMEVQTCLPKRT